MNQETVRGERIEAFSKSVIEGAVYPLAVNIALLVPLSVIALAAPQSIPKSLETYAAGAAAGSGITAGVLFLIASCFDGFGKRSEYHHPVSNAFGKMAGIGIPAVAAVIGALTFNAVMMCKCGPSGQAKAPVPAYAPPTFDR